MQCQCECGCECIVLLQRGNITEDSEGQHGLIFLMVAIPTELANTLRGLPGFWGPVTWVTWFLGANYVGYVGFGGQLRGFWGLVIWVTWVLGASYMGYMGFGG